MILLYLDDLPWSKVIIRISMIRFWGMPKKRTKQQKLRAQYHYAYPASRSFSGIKSDHEPRTEKRDLRFDKIDDVSGLYAYDPRYTRLDIRRTVFISLIILAFQLALYWWWK